MKEQPVTSHPQGRAQTTRLFFDEQTTRTDPPKTLHDDKPPATLQSTPPTDDTAVVANPNFKQPIKPVQTDAVTLNLSQPALTWSLAQSPATKGPRGAKASTNKASLAVAAHGLKGFHDRSEK